LVTLISLPSIQHHFDPASILMTRDSLGQTRGTSFENKNLSRLNNACSTRVNISVQIPEIHVLVWQEARELIAPHSHSDYNYLGSFQFDFPYLKA
jgi:hypothetical protein